MTIIFMTELRLQDSPRRGCEMPSLRAETQGHHTTSCCLAFLLEKAVPPEAVSLGQAASWDPRSCPWFCPLCSVSVSLGRTVGVQTEGYRGCVGGTIRWGRSPRETKTTKQKGTHQHRELTDSGQRRGRWGGRVENGEGLRRTGW